MSKLLLEKSKHKTAMVINVAILSTMLSSIGAISGCNSPEESYNDASFSEESYEAAADNIEAESLTVDNVSGFTEQALGDVVSDTKALGKQLIITVTATFKVDDVLASNKAIEALTRQQSGYVASSAIDNRRISSQTFTQAGKNIDLITYQRESRMTVRVPSEQVNDFLNQLKQQVKFLQYQKFEAKDVTLDIERERLATQLNDNLAGELSEERLNSDNADEQTSNVDSIVATYEAKKQAQYARLQQLEVEDRIKYSTIELSFTEPPAVLKEVTPNLDVVVAEYEPSFLSQVGNAVVTGWQTLKVAIITLIGLWWLIPVLFVLYLLFKLFKAIYRLLSGYIRQKK